MSLQQRLLFHKTYANELFKNVADTLKKLEQRANELALAKFISVRLMLSEIEKTHRENLKKKSDARKEKTGTKKCRIRKTCKPTKKKRKISGDEDESQEEQSEGNLVQELSDDEESSEPESESEENYEDEDDGFLCWLSETLVLFVFDTENAPKRIVSWMRKNYFDRVSDITTICDNIISTDTGKAKEEQKLIDLYEKNQISDKDFLQHLFAAIKCTLEIETLVKKVYTCMQDPRYVSSERVERYTRTFVEKMAEDRFFDPPIKVTENMLLGIV